MTITSTQITMEFDDGRELIWNYSMAANGQSMTVTNTAGSIALTFIKQ